MSEFKFPCPGCGQRIQATEAYSGHQINCPACQQALIVPQAPGAAAFAPAARSQSPAPVSQRPQPAAKKSIAKGVVIGSVSAFVIAGTVVALLMSGVFSRSGGSSETAPGQPASARSSVKDSASANLSGPTAAEIVQKVSEQYASLTSYSAKGTALTDMDLSKVDLGSMPGMDKKTKNSKQFQQSMPKRVKSDIEFSVRMGRPDFYRVEWESKSDVVGNFSMKGAAWSAGEGDFVSMNKTKYAKMDNRDMALASATGVSGGVAGTMPAIFFNDQSSALSFFNTAKRKPDETADGEDCYVLDGNAMGMKVILWVTKDKYLLKQKQMVFGGPSSGPTMTDAQMDEQLKKMPHLSAQEKADAKKAMKDMKPMLNNMKGTMTETYREIEINRPTVKTDFKYEMPAGAKLSKTLY